MEISAKPLSLTEREREREREKNSQGRMTEKYADDADSYCIALSKSFKLI